MKNKKSSGFLTDNLGWILLALLLAIILILAFPSIAEGFENGVKFLKDLI